MKKNTLKCFRPRNRQTTRCAGSHAGAQAQRLDQADAIDEHPCLGKHAYEAIAWSVQIAKIEGRLMNAQPVSGHIRIITSLLP